MPQHQLSRVVGKLAASEHPVLKNAVITAFKAQYGIDMSLAEQSNALKYKSFNDFFTRSLKQGVREIDSNPNSIVSPADGAISQLAIVKHVLMQHNAHLEVESKENQGSIFKAVFPKERLYYES